MNQESTMNNRKLIRLLIFAGLAVLLIWVGIKAWRTYQAATSLLNRQTEVEQILSSGFGAANPDKLEELVYGVRSDVVALEQEMGFLVPVLPYFGWLPKIGPLAASAPQLVEMADAGTEAAAFAFRGMKPALSILKEDEGGAFPIPQLLEVIETAKPDLAKASLAMDRVVSAREEIHNTEAFPWRVRNLFDLADQWLLIAADGLKMAPIMPEILGYYGPRRYLIIAQNENEIRATGGFISGAGLIEVDKGEIIRIDFRDANSVDAWADPTKTLDALAKPYGQPPKPLSELMLLDLFLFRDANYWPDFPLSAQKAMDLYSYGQDVPPLDGAIAIDQQFMSLLLSGVGPIQIPDSGEVINQNNIINSLQEAWTLQDGVLERKSFLGTFSLAIYERLQNESSTINPISLAKSMGEALQKKHLQFYFTDPSVSRVIKDIGWDGRLIPPDGNDALLIVDTNVGYNKANLFIDMEAEYAVKLENDGGSTADLTITHRHTGEEDGEPCWQGTMDEYRNGEPYIALAEKCYWNYLRVYVPEGSTLISGPQHLVPGDTWFGGFDWDRPTDVTAELPGFTTFTNFMLLQKGEELQSQFHYTLPQTIISENGDLHQYKLQILKQAGVKSYPITVNVILPEGTVVDSITPSPSGVNGNTITFDIELDSDQWITISYK